MRLTPSGVGLGGRWCQCPGLESGGRRSGRLKVHCPPGAASQGKFGAALMRLVTLEDNLHVHIMSMKAVCPASVIPSAGEVNSRLSGARPGGKHSLVPKFRRSGSAGTGAALPPTFPSTPLSFLPSSDSPPPPSASPTPRPINKKDGPHHRPRRPALALRLVRGGPEGQHVRDRRPDRRLG